jgi:hypothetical protein
MADAFTKRNHFNPCFWTALWNEEYFENWVRAEQSNTEPREQLIFALNLRSNKIYKTKVANLFYEKNLGLGVCLSNPSLRGKGDAGRCETAGSKTPEAYSLEYVEEFFGPRTTQMLADRLPE